MCVCRERERDHNKDFTVLKKRIRIFRYVANITTSRKEDNTIRIIT